MTCDVLLLRDLGGAMAVKHLEDVNVEHLRTLAQLAREQGFHLMYQCSSRPDMGVVQRMLAAQQSLVELDFVDKLWVIREPR